MRACAAAAVGAAAVCRNMNLEIPYERLLDVKRVEYIPLKLAIDDGNDATAADNSHVVNNTLLDSRSNNKLLTMADYTKQQNDRMSSLSSSQQSMPLLTIALLSIFCVLVLLYAVYYFVILRETNDHNSRNHQPNSFYAQV